MFTSLRMARAAAAALTAPLLLVGAACSQDASAETVTSVLDVGAADDAVALPPAPTAGQSASGPFSLGMNLEVSAGGQDISVDVRFQGDIRSEVVDVGTDGGYVLRSTFSDVEIEGSEPDIVSELERAIPDGLTYEETYDEHGQRESIEVVDTGVSGDELAAAEEFVSQAETGNLYPPGAPVGLGATWTATTMLSSSGADVEMVVLSELSTLTDTEYAVDMTIDSDVDTEIEGERLTGSISGGGRVTGSRSNPLDVEGSMTVDMEMSGGGMSMTMDMSVEYDFAALSG